MTNQRIRKAVSIVNDDDINGILNKSFNVPLYDVKNKLLSCDTYDKARAVIRESKPVNVVKGTTGLFVTEITTGIKYEPITLDKVLIATFDNDKIILTENAVFIGMTDKIIYVKDKDDKTRAIKKDSSVVIIE